MIKTIKSLLVAAVFLLAISIPTINSYAEEGHEGHQHAEPNMTPIPYNENDPLAKKALEIKPEDVVMGKAEAPVTIIEYASLSCPHCAMFSKDVFPEIKEKYIETGKAKFIYRHFPLNRPAIEAAMIAECSGKMSYYNSVKTLFTLQEYWAFKQNNNMKLREISKELGVDSEQFDKCLADKALQDRLLSGMKEASQILRVGGTPTFFINGKMLNKASPDDVKQAIETALKQ
jgi:protein-disulfide isomerase